VESYRALKKEIDEIVGRIVGEYSANAWSPIHYHHGSVNFEELIALYSAADIALVTPLRDGMNLVCKEYLASHSDEDGVLILSKFAGASAEITECLTVNPYSIEEIRDAIYRALHMPREERRKRMAAMRRIVSAHPIQSWLQKCLEEFDK
jgi:trehalose-6-phosphate synthase